jgi:hypothetical protein
VGSRRGVRSKAAIACLRKFMRQSYLPAIVFFYFSVKFPVILSFPMAGSHCGRRASSRVVVQAGRVCGREFLRRAQSVMNDLRFTALIARPFCGTRRRGRLLTTANVHDARRSHPPLRWTALAASAVSAWRC